MKPLIEEGHEEFVHHMVLYECVSGTDEEFAEFLDSQGHQCFHPNMPDSMRKCEGVSIAWAVGGEVSANVSYRRLILTFYDVVVNVHCVLKDLTFPEHVGLPLEPAPAKYYMLEIHYDNPTRRQGKV